MRPNILFILVDQMRPDTLTAIKLPHIRALAQRGVTFDHMYAAAPLCQPSRNCIVMGQYPVHTGICGNLSAPLEAETRQDTYANHLRAAGYHTALIGKHHFLDRYRTGTDVIATDQQTIQSYGFDDVIQVVDDHLNNEDAYTQFLRERGKLEAFQEMTRTGTYRSDVLDVDEFDDGFIGAQGAAYIRNYDDDAPFFLNVSFLGPHPPHWVTGEYADRFDPDDMPRPKSDDPRILARAKRNYAAYFGRCALIDSYVGKMVKALDERGTLNNTVIVFAADHGELMGDYGIFDKRYFFEQSVTVPMIIAGPGFGINPRIGPRTNKCLTSLVDLYPTFLDIAGCENITGNAPREGLSLLRILDERVPFRQAVFSELVQYRISYVDKFG